MKQKNVIPNSQINVSKQQSQDKFQVAFNQSLNDREYYEFYSLFNNNKIYLIQNEDEQIKESPLFSFIYSLFPRNVQNIESSDIIILGDNLIEYKGLPPISGEPIPILKRNLFSMKTLKDYLLTNKRILFFEGVDQLKEENIRIAVEYFNFKFPKINLSSVGDSSSKSYQFDRNEKSKLKQITGYTAKEKSNKWERQDALLHGIIHPELGLKKVVYFLQFLIHDGKNNPTRQFALNKYLIDLGWLKSNFYDKFNNLEFEFFTEQGKESIPKINSTEKEALIEQHNLINQIIH